jgi:hypothetical protein
MKMHNQNHHIVVPVDSSWEVGVGRAACSLSMSSTDVTGSDLQDCGLGSPI